MTTKLLTRSAALALLALVAACADNPLGLQGKGTANVRYEAQCPSDRKECMVALNLMSFDGNSDNDNTLKHYIGGGESWRSDELYVDYRQHRVMVAAASTYGTVRIFVDNRMVMEGASPAFFLVPAHEQCSADNCMRAGGG